MDAVRLQEIVAYQRQVHEQMLNSKGPLSVSELQKFMARIRLSCTNYCFQTTLCVTLLNNLKQQVREELRERAQAIQ